MIFLNKYSHTNNRVWEIFKSSERMNCFNPSIAFSLTGELHLTFRAIENSENFICGYYARPSLDGSYSIINLSKMFSQSKISRVADPKLLRLGDELYVTFNTGYSEIKNKLYLMKVHPEVETPKECHYAFSSSVEKNWAFFKLPNKEKLYVVYSCDPLIVLAADGWNGSAIEFKKIYEGKKRFPKKDISIGTPIVECNGEYRFIAHRKVRPFLKKRVYLGMAAKLKKTDNIFTLEVSNKTLVHSLGSLVGSRKKHNKNLLSCTYFSGLQLLGHEQVLISYGINDVGYGFSKINWNKLW